LEIYCQTIQELPEVSKKIISYGNKYNVWVLKGDLGAGKTTFIKEVARQMNVMDNISSPSYALINEYLTPTQEKIYHLDLFRVETISEVLDLGFDEYLDSGLLCFIEWPEIAEPLLPESYLEISILNPEKELRVFNINKHG
jgi:tRNA threonylcarbamoyladenosine biosynthesis protein TsaE